MRIRGILLAGGASSRFGAQKLAHPLSDGTPIGRRAALNLRAAVDDVLVVHRPNDETVVRIFAGLPVTLFASARCHEGMGGSLAAAIAVSAAADAWIIALADMPFIAPPTIQAVRDVLAQGADIVQPVHAGQGGHPVGFAARLGAELAQLAGDEGARGVLRRHAANIRRVAVGDANIRRDVDVPGDLATD